ncbi:MAG TPA: glycosyltransferase family A protein [Candidatus Limnocylindrales bacterium]|nr:glycosyltransferase family A protein [Candidatus Limnocylindrales bacterium]
MPRVTIVTCCWNSEAYLGRTIDSVIAQSFPDWEHVVVDDGSPGDFTSVVEPYVKAERRIRTVRQSNGGLCNARNAGYRAAAEESEYLLFLDADDCLETSMLATLVAELDAHPEAGMAFCDRTIIDAEDRPIDAFKDEWILRIVPAGLGGRQLTDREAETPFIAFFAFNIVVPSLTLIRRSVFDRVGAWDEALGPIYDDTDMWLRISLASTARYVPQRLLRRRIHGAQLTRGAEGGERRRQATSRFHAKWSNPTWLDQSDRRRVSRAHRVRAGRLAPYLWFGWARQRAGRREWLEAARCAGRGLMGFGLHGPRAFMVSWN